MALLLDLFLDFAAFLEEAGAGLGLIADLSAEGAAAAAEAAATAAEALSETLADAAETAFTDAAETLNAGDTSSSLVDEVATSLDNWNSEQVTQFVEDLQENMEDQYGDSEDCPVALRAQQRLAGLRAGFRVEMNKCDVNKQELTDEQKENQRKLQDDKAKAEDQASANDTTKGPGDTGDEDAAKKKNLDEKSGLSGRVKGFLGVLFGTSGLALIFVLVYVIGLIVDKVCLAKAKNEGISESAAQTKCGGAACGVVQNIQHFVSKYGVYAELALVALFVFFIFRGHPFRGTSFLLVGSLMLWLFGTFVGKALASIICAFGAL